MVQEVHRIFDIDFIYFDLMLVTIWIVILLVRKRFKQLLIGLFGYGVTQFTDSVIWYTLRGTRHIGIEGDVIGPHLFLTYFSFTYGMIMFSYAVLMYDRKIHWIEKALYSALMWCGWLAIGLISQNVAWNDTTIDIYREMAQSRLIQIIAVCVEYLILIIWKLVSVYKNGFPWNLMKTVRWWYIGLIFLIGFFIHFSMESTLMIAGIRPLDWSVFFFNSFIEFNTGAPILFIVWVLWNMKDYKPNVDAIVEIHEKDITSLQTEPIKE
ncbi:MAG: hypothetical protein ACFFDW_15295 [Candidatus Thorarchaeota archaeon]